MVCGGRPPKVDPLKLIVCTFGELDAEYRQVVVYDRAMDGFDLKQPAEF
jgi:hypothetical protein